MSQGDNYEENLSGCIIFSQAITMKFSFLTSNSNHIWLRYYKSLLGLSYLIDDCIFRVFLFRMNVCDLYLPHLLRKWKNVFLGNPLKSFEVHILLSLKYFIITLNDISISWVTHMATSLNLYTNMSRKDWLKHELRRKIKC